MSDSVQPAAEDKSENLTASEYKRRALEKHALDDALQPALTGDAKEYIEAGKPDYNFRGGSFGPHSKGSKKELAVPLQKDEANYQQISGELNNYRTVIARTNLGVRLGGQGDGRILEFQSFIAYQALVSASVAVEENGDLFSVKIIQVEGPELVVPGFSLSKEQDLLSFCSEAMAEKARLAETEMPKVNNYSTWSLRPNRKR